VLRETEPAPQDFFVYARDWLGGMGRADKKKGRVQVPEKSVLGQLDSIMAITIMRFLHQSRIGKDSSTLRIVESKDPRPVVPESRSFLGKWPIASDFLAIPLSRLSPRHHTWDG